MHYGKRYICSIIYTEIKYNKAGEAKKIHV